MTVDVSDIGCEFLRLFRHKLYGPTASGILWGRAELLRRSPWQGGGAMIDRVTFGAPASPPRRRGSRRDPSRLGVARLEAAIAYVENIG